TLVLVGATTENPSFEVIPALLSRARVVTLRALGSDDLDRILELACHRLDLTPEEEARRLLADWSGGDARRALNSLQETVDLFGPSFTAEQVRGAMTSGAFRYDKGGEEHYNTISAFIKSMRASDVDAALHYLARMIEAGEDPKFIARRMVIFASEDVGLQEPSLLGEMVAVFQAVERIGYPECALNLAQGVCRLALAPKSRAVTHAINDAIADVQKTGPTEIPMHLRNAPTKLMKDLGYGSQEGRAEGNLPNPLQGRRYLKEE
ncbi:MAG: replication-associated recombination protein A, partial [Fimbriimonadaceae bacterium]|nr:replication-associated recombination protein A [Fimbriimonadaceae bacterium]